MFETRTDRLLTHPSRASLIAGKASRASHTHEPLECCLLNRYE
jgi:hypothetical protein